MSTTKQQYWRYSLIIIISILGVTIAYQAIPFWGGILGACTIYLLVRKQMKRLTEKRKIGRSNASLLIIAEVVICFFIPVFAALWLLVNHFQSMNFEPTELIKTIKYLADSFEARTGYDLLSSKNIETITIELTGFIESAIGQIGSFFINVVILLFVLYFMLVGSPQMESYIYDMLPFNNENKKKVLSEANTIVISNAIGIPLLALAQGVIAFIGYMIFGTPDPLLFAFLTCFATIIPLLGTGLVWFPLALYLGLSGDWVNAAGLVIYALVLITSADNVVRLLLQKKLSDTHPLITIFGVIIGLPIFGFWGVILGPLILSVFFLCIDIYKKEYIDKYE